MIPLDWYAVASLLLAPALLITCAVLLALVVYLVCLIDRVEGNHDHLAVAYDEEVLCGTAWRQAYLRERELSEQRRVYVENCVAWYSADLADLPSTTSDQEI